MYDWMPLNASTHGGGDDEDWPWQFVIWLLYIMRKSIRYHLCPSFYLSVMGHIVGESKTGHRANWTLLFSTCATRVVGVTRNVVVCYRRGAVVATDTTCSYSGGGGHRMCFRHSFPLVFASPRYVELCYNTYVVFCRNFKASSKNWPLRTFTYITCKPQ